MEYRFYHTLTGQDARANSDQMGGKSWQIAYHLPAKIEMGGTGMAGITRRRIWVAGIRVTRFLRIGSRRIFFRKHWDQS